MASLQHYDYDGCFAGATCLITGGAGFIGSAIAERLIALGSRVRIIDDLSSGSERNIPEGVESFTHASILDEAAMRKATDGCRFVFHEAAMVSVPQSVEQPDECLRINIAGTQAMLQAARQAGVRRVLFAASAAAYGPEPRLPCREHQAPDCVSPYASSKVAGELLLRAFSTCYRLSTVSLRYFNIFGPKQNPDSPYAAVISAFAKALTNGTQPTIFGDGSQTRDFTHIDNVVHANLLAASSTGPLAGDVINIGTGIRISLLDVLEVMGRALRFEVAPTFKEPRAGDVPHSVADISRARVLLGYEPITSFEDGLTRMLTASANRAE